MGPREETMEEAGAARSRARAAPGGATSVACRCMQPRAKHVHAEYATAGDAETAVTRCSRRRSGKSQKGPQTLPRRCVRGHQARRICAGGRLARVRRRLQRAREAHAGECRQILRGVWHPRRRRLGRPGTGPRQIVAGPLAGAQRRTKRGLRRQTRGKIRARRRARHSIYRVRGRLRQRVRGLGETVIRRP